MFHSCIVCLVMGNGSEVGWGWMEWILLHEVTSESRLMMALLFSTGDFQNCLGGLLPVWVWERESGREGEPPRGRKEAGRGREESCRVGFVHQAPRCTHFIGQTLLHGLESWKILSSCGLKSKGLAGLWFLWRD